MRNPTTDPRVHEAYRRALRGFANTVSIISARHDKRNAGITVTTVTSVSMDPPSLLVAVNQAAGSHATLAASAGFCVNVLAHTQAHQSQVFSRPLPMEERFEQGDWRLSPEDLPYLVDAQSNIFCEKVATHVYGTHSLFIGRVIRIATSAAVSPLLYLDGRYLESERRAA